MDPEIDYLVIGEDFLSIGADLLIVGEGASIPTKTFVLNVMLQWSDGSLQIEGGGDWID